MNNDEFLQIEDWVDKHDEFINREGNEKSTYMVATIELIRYLKSLVKGGGEH